MKRQILRATFLGMLVLFGGTLANAQGDSTIKANIPFDFYVGDKKMTAGKYMIERVRPQSDQSVLALRRRDGEGQTVIMTTIPITLKKKGEANLSFNRYGGVYYLAEIRDGYRNVGRKLQQTKAEIELAREFTSPKVETASSGSAGKSKAEAAKGLSN